MLASDASRSEALSRRGRRLVDHPPNPEYLHEHFARVTKPYDPVARPGGYIPLCVAENMLVADLLLPKMASCRDVPARVLGYDTMTGSLEFRRQLARFMARSFLGREFRPEQIAVLAGAGCVLEALFYVLADPGDGVLVPTPTYAGFWPDLQTRNGLAVVPVHRSRDDGFRLSESLLDASVAAAGRRVRALLLTSPDNPLGRVQPTEELEMALQWSSRVGLHLVVDEVYALSVFGDRPFTSVAALRPSLGSAVHVVWAFSKDFAASGLRCGVLVSENEAVMRAVDGLADWACCSGDTQFLLGEMVSDSAWVDAYVDRMRARLGAACRRVAAALDAAAIPYMPSEAGFFLLCDLRRYLAAPTWDAERELWRRVLDGSNVNLTPGAACGVGEPGFMRLCFASVPADVVVRGVEKVARALR